MKPAPLPPPTLTPLDRAALASDLAHAEAQVRRLARMRTKTTRCSYWVARRDGLRATLALLGVGASQ